MILKTANILVKHLFWRKTVFGRKSFWKKFLNIWPKMFCLVTNVFLSTVNVFCVSLIFFRQTYFFWSKVVNCFWPNITIKQNWKFPKTVFKNGKYFDHNFFFALIPQHNFWPKNFFCKNCGRKYFSAVNGFCRKWPPKKTGKHWSFSNSDLRTVLEIDLRFVKKWIVSTILILPLRIVNYHACFAKVKMKIF